MKKLILIFALLITVLSYGQITKFQVAGYKTLTTIQRDALTVTSGEKWTIYNSDTFQFEYWNGTVWVALVGDGATNLSYNAATREVISDTGTNAVLTLVDGTNAGLASVADKAKIDGAIQGTISPTQIALGDTATDDIIGDANLTWNGTYLGIGATNATFRNTQALGFVFENNLGDRIFRLTSNTTAFIPNQDASFFQFGRPSAMFTGNNGLKADYIGFYTGGVVIDSDSSTFTTIPIPTTLLDVLGDSKITGQLEVQTDPTLDTHVGNRLFNDGRYIPKSADVLSQAVSYTTVTADTGKKIDFTGGTVITLDDAGVNIGDQFDFYNNTGSPMSWAFGSGDGSIETISDLPDKTHGYARLVAANSWTVIDGVIQSASTEFSKVPTLSIETNTTKSLSPISQFNRITKFTNVAGCTLTLNQDTTYNLNELKQEHFVQAADQPVTIVAGAGVTFLTTGTTPKTLDKGSVVTAVWLTATEILLTGRMD